MIHDERIVFSIRFDVGLFIGCVYHVFVPNQPTEQKRIRKRKEPCANDVRASFISFVAIRDLRHTVAGRGFLL